MLQIVEKLEYVVGNAAIAQRMEQRGGKEIFAAEVESFLHAVSSRLLHNPEAKKYSDVISFAFWCRRSSVKAMRLAYMHDAIRRGRGTVFHIAPSNVAVNFAYSFATGLMAGNANIVRLPSKEFYQVELICAAIQGALSDGFANLQEWICFVRYSHNEAITAYFSSLCDTRVIWGGNASIQSIRQAQLKPRANEITFADRFSFALINADAYLAEGAKESIAQAFYNDTYLSDQNACTSPRLVVWLGDNVAEAREVFWQELYKIVEEKYNLQPIQAADKLVAAYSLATQGGYRIIKTPSNLLIRMEAKELTVDLSYCRNHSGFFIEYKAQQLEDILPLCGGICQTVAVYGVENEKLADFIETHQPAGIDRIVAIGRTLDFSLVWDGIDLVRSMSRCVIMSR